MMKVLLCLCAFLVGFALADHTRIKLQDAKEIRFRSDRLTDPRREDPVPQIHPEFEYLVAIKGCVDCNLPDSYYVEILCMNFESFDGTHDWNCIPQGDMSIMFTSVKIDCEGYDHDWDEYISLESCVIMDATVNFMHTIAKGSGTTLEPFDDDDPRVIARGQATPEEMEWFKAYIADDGNRRKRQ